MWDAPVQKIIYFYLLFFVAEKAIILIPADLHNYLQQSTYTFKISEEHMLNISFYWFLMQMLMYVCFILSLSHTTTYSLFIFFSNIKSEGNPCVINVNSQKRFFSHFLHSMIPNLFLKPINNVKICQICIK